MKKIGIAFVFIFLLWGSRFCAQIIIEEEFNGGTTPPAGWTFTSIGSIYNTYANYGKTAPSIGMDVTGDQITSIAFTAGTANTITFWGKATGAPTLSDIVTIEYFDGLLWNSCAPATFTFNTTARIFEASFPNTATQIRITYTKVTLGVNVAIDDFTILNKTASCTASNFLWFTSIVFNSCNADSCEGRDEFLSFQNGNSALNLNDLEITVPTSGVGPEGTTFCGTSANNPCDEFFTTNAAYVTALNGVAGCTGFFLSPPGNVIPANARVIVFMGNAPTTPINFGTLCSSGGNYYCVFVSNTTNCAGRYSNSINALRFTTIRNRSTGCSVERAFNPSAGVNNDGAIVAFNPAGTPSYISNPGCAGFVVLPIELTDFYATQEEEGVRLTWNVASEVNTREYWIEKSVDAINWIKFETVMPSSQSNKNLSYHALDNSPVKGLNYYRLSNVDNDGKVTLQPIISANFMNKSNNFSYSQNEDDLIITSNTTLKNAQLNLLDVTGRIVKKISIDVNTPAFVSKRDIGKGLFLLQCETYPQLGVSKIIIY